MRQPPVRLGPLALLLTVISICLAILAILTFTTARADLRLAEKYARTVSERYALEKEGGEYLAALSAGRESPPEPDGEGVMHAELERNGLRLQLAFRPDGRGGYELLSRRQEKEWEATNTIDNLWSGSFGGGG